MLHRLALAWLAFAATSPPPRFEHQRVDDASPVDVWLKATGDLNGDGRPDLIAGGYAKGGLVWYENPSWQKHVIHAEGSFSTDGEVADIDGDSRPDIVAVMRDRVVWFKGPSWEMSTIATTVVHDIEVADFDRDSRLDVAGRNQGAFRSRGDQLFLWRQSAPNSWTARAIPIPDGEGLATADIDGDGDQDLVVNRIWLENPGTADGEWRQHDYGSSWIHPHAFVATGDINGDRRPDIVLSPAEPAGSTYRISWFAAPRDPRRTPWTEHVVEAEIETVHHFVGVADFNLDRRLDIATARMHQGKSPEVALYLNQNRGRGWQKQVIAPVSSHSMRIADLDRDTRPDLYGANWRGQGIDVWWNRPAAPSRR